MKTIDDLRGFRLTSTAVVNVMLCGAALVFDPHPGWLAAVIGWLAAGIAIGAAEQNRDEMKIEKRRRREAEDYAIWMELYDENAR